MDAKKMKTEETILLRAKGIWAEVKAQYPEMERMTITFCQDDDFYVTVRAAAKDETILDGSIWSRGHEDN